MKVSVVMITYNHEKFIAQAIDSVLMQEIKFDYEIVIGEDCSTDNTRHIVIDFQKRYPDKIRLLLPEQNLGMLKNFITTIQACRGEYTAILEGDDYWTSPHKLQRQIDFLDNHPECTICFHDVTEIYEDNSKQPWRSICGYQKEILELEDLLKHNIAYTCTAMFRKSVVKEFPDWYSMGLVKAGDYPLWIFCAEKGKIGYLHEVMAVYRIHSGGVWSSQKKNKQLQDEIIVNEYINQYLNFKYQNTIKKKKYAFYYEIAEEYEKQGNYYQSIQYFKKLLIESIFIPVFSRKKILKRLIKLLYLFFKNPQKTSQ